MTLSCKKDRLEKVEQCFFFSFFFFFSDLTCYFDFPGNLMTNWPMLKLP